MDDLQLNNLQKHWDTLITSAISWAPRIFTAVVSALLIYLIGSWMIRMIKKLVAKGFKKRNMEASLQHFLLNIINWGLNILLFIVVVTQLGVQTSAFVAMIGAAGLAVGLALQGSLTNFAGGILILLLKPFKIGDFISTNSGVSGTVQAIDIFHTKLITPQNQLIIIPNGVVSNNSITNFTQLGTRRTSLDIGVAYDADLKQTKEVLMRVIQKNQYALSEPAPQVMVTALGDSAINLSVRVSATTENFWKLNEELIIDCKEALDKAEIGIPFPQRDIHVYNK
ncbi:MULTISPECIES: mechanosensitive ion channel family protein [unclassified Chryseobacterium]|uniref:mechanosensitive ion channel family protein n=1 Tax=unclassified Chryseobacterium TaxID=2593645 RepID=UPI00100C00D4|nr:MULTISPECIES: mechanosensitive ion channel family protein [unclassified Chryseobacterium]RXM52450.1 mechanosensitive ion channel protein [Chryseobacterium sp. CH25]RXM66511.1 mechanosensitive ion channel protein [Chryseobacterium sp. CH1]